MTQFLQPKRKTIEDQKKTKDLPASSFQRIFFKGKVLLSVCLSWLLVFGGSNTG
jgi:hypothetical protein